MKRTLRIRRDVLPDLTTDEMGTVAGGTHVGCTVTHGNTSCDLCPTVPINDCLDTRFCLITTPIIAPTILNCV